MVATATPIAPDVWRLGAEVESGDETRFSLDHNSYLLRLSAEPPGDAAPHWLWVDPGGADRLAALEPPVRRLMGDDAPLLVVATGLAEGAVGALPAVMEHFPQALLLTNFDTWNFLSITGVPEERVRLVERYRPGLRFPGIDRGLQVVANPYGQFTGALLLFEPRSGCLLSGELLAGEAGEARPTLFATQEDWPAIRQLQERRMPCNAALRWTLDRVRQLEGLRWICPQSGPLLHGEVLPDFLRRLEGLPVGADLLVA
jgi:flavorubredoxin